MEIDGATGTCLNALQLPPVDLVLLFRLPNSHYTLVYHIMLRLPSIPAGLRAKRQAVRHIVSFDVLSEYPTNAEN